MDNSFDSMNQQQNYNYQQPNESLFNPSRLRSERDLQENQIEKSLVNLKLDAANTQRDTNRALDRLN